MKQRKQLAIIGNGMATCRLLDGLASKGGLEHYQITVWGEEAYGAYNRIQLGKVLSGEGIDAVLTKPVTWYEKQGVELRRSVQVHSLDTSRREVVQADGERAPYDLAILATGSQPVVPPIRGLKLDDGAYKPGAFVYRSVSDALAMREHVRVGDSAVVLGGGLLGLEAAKALSDLGLHVTVVHLAASLMNTQLDEFAAAMLRKRIERSGIFVRTGRTVVEAVGSEQVEGVVLDNGDRLPADLLVVACGVRPRIDVAKNSGLAVNRGVIVNDCLATPVPGVYAVGECVEHREALYGLVAPAWEQAEVLTDILTAKNPAARYEGSKTYARLKVAGVEVAALGVLDRVVETDQVLQVIEEGSLSYRKLVVRGRQLIGAMMVGNTSSAAGLIQAFDRGTPLPEDPLLALVAPGSSSPVQRGPRTICNCHRVSDETITQAVAQGADSVEKIGAQTKAGTGCGSCKGELERLVQAGATRSLKIA